MKKIGIITINGFNNYGNRLQCYAVQHYLENMGYIDENIYNEYNSNSFIGNCVKSIIRKLRDFNKRKIIAIRNQNFYEFNKYIKFSKERIINGQFNQGLNENYDLFITGSDQVWAPVSSRLEMYMQSTIPSTKKYSSATSIAAYDILENLKGKYREYLSDFRFISVRENKSKELLEDILVGKDIRVDLAPTLRLRKHDWEKIEKKPKWISNQKKYILVYNLDSSIPIELQVFAKKNGFDILSLMYESSKAYKSDPSELIYLIHNAELVYTDSYHGTIFAILFEKQFIHATRQQNTVGHSMNSRFDTLFDKLGINSQKVSRIDKKY